MVQRQTTSRWSSALFIETKQQSTDYEHLNTLFIYYAWSAIPLDEWLVQNTVNTFQLSWPVCSCLPSLFRPQWRDKWYSTRFSARTDACQKYQNRHYYICRIIHKSREELINIGCSITSNLLIHHYLSLIGILGLLWCHTRDPTLVIIFQKANENMVWFFHFSWPLSKF